MLNQFKFQIVHVQDKRSSYFQTKIWIDNEEFYGDTSVHLENFVNSLYQSGSYFLMTCSCGHAGCAGFFHKIRVKTKEDTVVWMMPNFGMYRKHQLAKIVLSRAQIYAEITQELKRVYPFLKTRWQCEIHTEVTPTHYLFVPTFPFDSNYNYSMNVTKFNTIYRKLLENPIVSRTPNTSEYEYQSYSPQPKMS